MTDEMLSIGNPIGGWEMWAFVFGSLLWLAMPYILLGIWWWNNPQGPTSPDPPPA